MRKVTGVRRHILACAVSEPGEWTARSILEDMDYRPHQTWGAVAMLRRDGMLRGVGAYAVLTRNRPEILPGLLSTPNQEKVWAAVVRHQKTDRADIAAVIAAEVGLCVKGVSDSLTHLRKCGAITPLHALFPTRLGRLVFGQ